MGRARVKVTTKDIDRGYKSLVSRVGNLKGAYVQIGLQDGDKADKRVVRGGKETIVKTNTPIAMIAAYNEFGTDLVPSRPFMRNAWEKNEKEVNKRVKAEWNAVLAKGKDPGLSLAALGEWYQSKIQTELTTGEFEPNSDLTIKRKHSSRPLIDTGRMRQSIRYIVKGIK